MEMRNVDDEACKPTYILTSYSHKGGGGVGGGVGGGEAFPFIALLPRNRGP